MSPLTSTENIILKLLPFLSAKEIAEKRGISVNTVNVHLKSIKEKIGLQKSTELVAYYLLSKVGKTLTEYKKEILSSVLALAIISLQPFNQSAASRSRRRAAFRHKVEYAVDAPITA